VVNNKQTKYRVKLQIRRRRDRETLSELHQDIRRLKALAYPRLTTDAREKIACDHFINVLDDPEFALKVKKGLLDYWMKP